MTKQECWSRTYLRGTATCAWFSSIGCLNFWSTWATSTRFASSTFDYLGVEVSVAAFVDNVMSAHFGGGCSGKYRELGIEILN